MFKIQYPTDHLKKEGVNSKITESSDEIEYIEQAKEFPHFKRYRRSDVDSESGSRIKRIDVPGDGSCLFWSVTMAYLIPVRNDDALFRQRYEVLFGNDGTVTQNLDHIYVLKVVPSLKTCFLALLQNFSKLLTTKTSTENQPIYRPSQ